MPAVASRPAAPVDLRTAPTAPLRVYAFDHQPIRLLAEMEAVSAAELVHRAVAAYMQSHKGQLAQIHRQTQRHLRDGDLDGLAAVLSDVRRNSTQSDAG